MASSPLPGTRDWPIRGAVNQTRKFDPGEADISPSLDDLQHPCLWIYSIYLLMYVSVTRVCMCVCLCVLCVCVCVCVYTIEQLPIR